MAGDILLGILQTAVLRLPSFVVGAVGLWFAFARRREHPRVSKIAMVGFGALLVSAILFLGMQLWIQYAIANGDGARVSEVMTRWNLIGYPLNLISLIAMGVAVFIDRRPSSNRTQIGEYGSAA